MAWWLGWRYIEGNNAVLFVKNDLGRSISGWKNFDSGRTKAYIRAFESIMKQEGL